MPYKSIEFRASINTSPSPPIRCPYYFAHGKENCTHCHFRGNILEKEICDYLGYLLRREINSKKLDYLKSYIEDNP